MPQKSIQKVSIRQVKAARALLAWSQEQLAKAADISIPTIKRLEANDGPLGGSSKTAEMIQSALERAGIEFIDENGGGAGVRLRKPHRLSARVSHGIASEDKFARSSEPRRIITHDTPEIKQNRVITAEQLRAARGLLGWFQSELAAHAGLSLPTVKRVESESGPRVSVEARMKLKKALETAGVGFTDENGGGLGVHLRKRGNTPK
jgi:transcriptional regulator with XRE-family HTH domain